MHAMRAVGAIANSRNEKTPKFKGAQVDLNLNDRGDICRLLDLAPELRNRIYRYVVCEDEPIEVTEDTREPGLLSTCRQIRAEARSIWFLENRFEFHIRELDITLLSLFYRRQKKHLRKGSDSGKVRKVTTTHKHYNWANLMRWCKVAFDGDVWCLRPVPGKDAHYAVVANATHMAQKQLKVAGATWETCYQTLQYFRAVAGATDKRWLDD